MPLFSTSTGPINLSRCKVMNGVLTEGILGLDGAVGVEGLGLALVGDGGHAELVLHALLEALDVKGQRSLVAGDLTDLDEKAGSVS